MIAETTTWYYYDDQRVLRETDVRYFVYGNYIVEVLLMADVDNNNQGLYIFRNIS